MARLCQDCGREGGAQREQCVYCGGRLPLGDPVEVPTPRSLPPDLDEMVRLAMSQGSVDALHSALSSDVPGPASAASVSPVAAPPEPLSKTSLDEISVADALADLGEGLDDARLAWISGDVGVVRSWAEAAGPTLRAVLQQLAREEEAENPQLSLIPDPSPEPPVPPVILMPKVRHPLALVVEGMGDPERGPALAEALGVDGVTARLVAMCRYPRFVLRGDDEAQLNQAAEQVQSALGIRAVVVSRDAMLAIGPARGVTGALSSEPLQLQIVECPEWDVDLTEPAAGELRTLTPDLRLAVAGEIVVHRFRAATQGGRLKHIREHRVQSVGETRLSVIDLHTDTAVLRLVQGATDMSGFPGHTPSAAVRSLRDYLSVLEQSVPVIPRRICQPGLDRPGGGAVAGQSSPTQDSGWAAFEEHSRACRLLYGL
jgi:hypothetical protein